MTNTPVPTTDNSLTKNIEAPKTKKAWLSRLLFFAIPILLIIVLSIGGLVYFYGTEKLLKIITTTETDKTPEDFLPKPLHVVDFDVITAELYSTEGESHLLSITLSLDSKSAVEAEELSRRKPIIEDAIVLFLRGLRPEDFVGNAGLERVRNEITRRVVDVVKPIRIQTLYIRNLTFTR